MRKVAYIKRSTGGMVFDILNGVFITIFTILVVYPFLNILAISFNDGIDAVRGGIYLWPRKFSLLNYEYVFPTGIFCAGPAYLFYGSS